MLPDRAAEERLYELERARAWARSGLITKDQLAKVEAGGPPPPALAGWAIRLLLFGLTALALVGAALFFGWDVHERDTRAMILLVEGVVAWGLAELLVAKFRLHRFGAEEALFLAGPLLAGIAVAELVRHGASGERLGAAFAAILYAMAYMRTRHPAAAVAGAFAAAAWASSFNPTREMRHLVLAMPFAALALASEARQDVPEWERDRWHAVSAVFALLCPLALNEKLSVLRYRYDWNPVPHTQFYWLGYILVWLIPVVTLALAIRSRRRPLLWAGAVGLLVAIGTNKPYFGIERQPWDPAVLGAVLLALAMWLDRALRGAKDGWTSEELVVGRDGGLSAAALLAAGAHAAPQVHAAPQQDAFKGGGGSSGGAGAGSSF